jgi:hypothetical protein
MTSTRPAIHPAWASPARHPAAFDMTTTPPPEAAVRINRVLDDYPSWSVFWDKAYGVWRAAEDDPDSAWYAESSDADTVIRYIQAHT